MMDTEAGPGSKSRQVCRILGILGAVLFLSQFLLFHALLIGCFLPGAAQAALEGFDELTYWHMAWAVVWIMGATFARRWLLQAFLLGRSQYDALRLFGWTDFVFVAPMSGVLWCLAFARESWHYWVYKTPPMASLMKAFGGAEVLVVGLSLLWTAWLWSKVPNRWSGKYRWLHIEVAVASLFVLQMVVVVAPGIIESVLGIIEGVRGIHT